MTSLTAIIKNLELCASQNEADAKAPGGYGSEECNQAAAVAAEQRRVIKLLKTTQGNKIDKKLVYAQRILQQIRKLGYDTTLANAKTTMLHCVKLAEEALGEIEK